ncbi:hypothetical protein PR048_033465 [Dryococelus australis]|uniref:HP domain-containing protein n=1 Tax=Dryococelus australis TaxID=614101 RepID=A0ABQ9G0D2_9NEOP|nr:hypothetical protein PR048_033465 [Dryococelus australis]
MEPRGPPSLYCLCVCTRMPGNTAGHSHRALFSMDGEKQPESLVSPGVKNAELPASSTFAAGLRYTASYSPHLRRSLPNMSHPMSTEPAKIYPYHLLQITNYRLPADVDRLNLERHLSDTEFELVFQCSRVDFYRMPQWRRNDLKRRHFCTTLACLCDYEEGGEGRTDVVSVSCSLILLWPHYCRSSSSYSNNILPNNVALPLSQKKKKPRPTTNNLVGNMARQPLPWEQRDSGIIDRVFTRGQGAANTWQL